MSVIQIKNLSKTFSTPTEQLQILKNINFEARAGESVAILGQSGSGKTTLLSLLTGLDSPDSTPNCSIKILGNELTNRSKQEVSQIRTQSIGIVFQQFHLISHFNALENVSMPLEISPQQKTNSEIKLLAAEALKQVGLSERLYHYPNMLSGGEKQRVAIARAFVNSPPIIVADEPTGNLDQETGNQILDILFNLSKKNKTCLIFVTHDLNLANRCDKKLVLSKGAWVL